jgi:hypothetical protein
MLLGWDDSDTVSHGEVRTSTARPPPIASAIVFELVSLSEAEVTGPPISAAAATNARAAPMSGFLWMLDL